MKKILYLLLLLASTLNAQVHFSNLSECLAFTKENNAQIKAEALNHKLSEERVKAAWSSLLPQVKAFGNLDNNLNLPVQLVPAQIFGGPEGEYAEVKFGTQYTASYGAEASLSLVNISNWRNAKSAAIGENVARHLADDKILGINEQLISAYYFALLSREAILLNQELVSAGDSLLSAAEVRLANGLIETLEFNRVKSLYLESVQALKESEGAFQKNINSVKYLSGIAQNDSLVLTENIVAYLEDNQQPSLLNVTVQNLPRYGYLSSRMLQSHVDLKRQNAKIFPELSLYARVSRQSFSNELQFAQWFDVAVAGLRAEWSVFSGFNRQANIRQASLQSKIASYELTNYSLQANRELEELSINHALSAQGVSRFMKHYELNLESFRIATVKYNEGVYTIDQYVTIYQERVRSQNQYLNKLANYLVYESIIQSRNTLN
jgi:outer membrane protein TolC